MTSSLDFLTASSRTNPSIGRRGFFRSTVAKAAHDASTIDYVSMPRSELPTERHPEITRIPLLPTNYLPPGQTALREEAIELVVRPQISTISAESTHIQSPSAMREVTDNDAIDLDPYNLTKKVAVAAAKLGHIPAAKANEEVGALRELWNGLLDDFLGGKKFVKT